MNKFEGTPEEWDKILSNLPNSHILQTWEWAQFKANYGWEPNAYTWEVPHEENLDSKQIKAAVMVLTRKIPIRGFASRLNVIYSPRGPVMDWSDQELRTHVLRDLESHARKQGAIFLKIDSGAITGGDPDGDQVLLDPEPGIQLRKLLQDRSWVFSQDQIQFRNTAIINLEQDEEKILAACKQKTRYNINLASRRGVTVRQGTEKDLDLLYRLYAETSIRDGFVIRGKDYYLTLWGKFLSNRYDGSTPAAIPLIAEFGGTPIAAILVFFFAEKVYYLYGMSSDLHRKKMPNYLLQWEAIKLAKTLGCKIYDLWGAPDELSESDPMWGVFRFKKGLGASLVKTIGAWDYPARPTLYWFYTQVIPKVLDIMRRRGRSQTRRSITPL